MAAALDDFGILSLLSVACSHGTGGTRFKKTSVRTHEQPGTKPFWQKLVEILGK
jgi:hypothetical protein